MKVCKYCGSECPDSVTNCPSCGGNTFQNKCVNCGNVFENGNFCPRCGIKVGAKAKRCPNCGAEYYSAACPDCGYTNHARKPDVVYAYPTAQPVKKRKTWLWVLGWIFIFPVPLTILMLRNKTLDKKIKYGIIVAVWIGYFVIASVGGINDNDDAAPAQKENNNTSSIVQESDVESQTTMDQKAVSDSNIFADTTSTETKSP